jgi:chemotaxis signal transduction protein
VHRDENVRDFRLGNEQSMLLVHLVLSVVSATRFSRIPEMQEENVMEYHHA